MSEELKKMTAAAIAMVSLTVTTLMGIVVVTQLKTSDYIDNTTADLFKAGLIVFGTFASLISLVLVAKIIIGLVKGGMSGD